MRLTIGTWLVLLAGCSTAGPFVMNITVARPGRLTIEKCMVEFEPFGGSVSNKNCTIQSLDIRDRAAPKAKPPEETAPAEPTSDDATMEQRILARLVPTERGWFCDRD